MEFSELIQCSHKIREIKVKNENKHSLFNHVVLKIHIDDNDIRDDETVVFSAEKNDEFLAYQRSDNDFFCVIPNKINSISTIYAHFFPSDLYEYDESEIIFSIYDFAELFDKDRVDFFGDPYDVQHDEELYESSIDEEGRLIVQSIDNNSVDRHHNPNYKNYLSNDANKTQQGYFPLSSIYRPTQNWQVPNIKDLDPKWGQKNAKPFWEVRIHRRGLSPLITDSALDDVPINVFLSYDYLPTSREYHQHYYGFEGEEPSGNTINVLEGENLHKIDNKFAEHKSTSKMKDSDKYNNYRLITRNNPYDDTKSFYVDHEHIIPINLQNFKPNIVNNTLQSCEWSKNKCHNFYVYKPLNINTSEEKYCSLNIELSAGKNYTLRYFVYIPTQATVANDECQIVVQTADHTYQTHQDFIYKDKSLRNQWIYHEVSFIATTNNKIKIIGPQNVNTNQLSNSVYFSNISLYQMDTYSPTLQYSKYGVQLTEEGQKTSRSEQDSTPLINGISPTTPPLAWSEYDIKLEQPYDEVYITVGDEEYLYYEKRTGDLKFSGTEGHIIYRPEDENDDTKKNFGSATSNIDLSYTKTGEKDGEVTATYVNNITGVYGPNNEYTFTFKDSNNNFVTDGTVEVGLTASIDDDTTLSTALMKFKQKPMEVNKTVTFSDIDFTDIQPNTTTPSNKYFLKIIYHNICQEKDKIIFKPIYLEPESLTISELRVNGSTKNNNNQDIISKGYLVETAEQVPIDIRVKITDQKNQGKTTGYCELSINDKLHQSTIVDDDGWADFYITPDDIDLDCYVIKIEYYREYNKSLAFIYFDLCIDSLEAIKPYIDVDVKLWTKGQNFTQPLANNQLIINDDDCVLASVTTREHEKFRLEIYRTNLCTNKTELLYANNIFNKIDRSINFIHAEQNDLAPYKFTFVTGNMYDDSRSFKKVNGSDVVDNKGNVILDIYRDYQKSYTIKKLSHQHCN